MTSAGQVRPDGVACCNEAVAFGLLETGFVSRITFAADWCVPGGHCRIAHYLRHAVLNEGLPRPEWALETADDATRTNIRSLMDEMDRQCRSRAQQALASVIPLAAIERAGLNPELTFENFAWSKGDELAYANAFIAGLSQRPDRNPLLIWGASSRKKTHLLHAIGHLRLQFEPGAIVRCLNVERELRCFLQEPFSRGQGLFAESGLFLLDHPDPACLDSKMLAVLPALIHLVLDRGAQLVIGLDLTWKIPVGQGMPAKSCHVFLQGT